MKKMILTRRQFMTILAAGTGTILLRRAAFTFPFSGPVISTDPFQLITLGKSGIKTTLLGMGTGFSGYNRSSNITRAGNGVAESLIHYAYEKGIRYFDCADSYGTHPFAKEALKSYPRDSYTIGTKMWVGQGGIPEAERPDANFVIDRFRKELNTDYIDLVQIHCMTNADWTDQQKRQMDILENLKSKMIIRAHGVSVHSFEALEAAAVSPWVDVIHVRINPYGESMDRKDHTQIVKVIEKLHNSGKGVIGMKLIGNGKFRNDPEKIEATLKFVFGLRTVDMIIIGFELPGQIDNYAGRVENALKNMNLV